MDSVCSESSHIAAGKLTDRPERGEPGHREGGWMPLTRSNIISPFKITKSLPFYIQNEKVILVMPVADHLPLRTFLTFTLVLLHLFIPSICG